MSEDLPLFLETEHAARVIGISVDQLRRHHEQFRAIRVGSKYLFPRGVILALSETGTLPVWQGSPEQASTTATTPDTGGSDGEKTGDNAKRADTNPRTTPTTAPARSRGGFARDFPEFAHLAS
jgi:hypothetical protein